VAPSFSIFILTSHTIGDHAISRAKAPIWSHPSALLVACDFLSPFMLLSQAFEYRGSRFRLNATTLIVGFLGFLSSFPNLKLFPTTLW
jgi:hypothetical protein